MYYINDGKPYRKGFFDIKSARRRAVAMVRSGQFLGTKVLKRIPSEYGIASGWYGVPIYTSETGNAIKGYVIGVDAYYWIERDKEYGHISHTILSDGSLHR